MVNDTNGLQINITQFLIESENYINKFKIPNLTVTHGGPNHDDLIYTVNYPDLINHPRFAVTFTIRPWSTVKRNLEKIVNAANQQIIRLLNKELEYINTLMDYTEQASPSTRPDILSMSSTGYLHSKVVDLDIIKRHIKIRSIFGQEPTVLHTSYPQGNSIKSLASHIITAIRQYEKVNNL